MSLFVSCARDAAIAASRYGVLTNAAAILPSSFRAMAVYVEVKENRVQQALSELNRKREEAGIPEELRKRRHYLNDSSQQYERNKNSYKHAVGAVVTERIKWVLKRKGLPAQK